VLRDPPLRVGHPPVAVGKVFEHLVPRRNQFGLEVVADALQHLEPEIDVLRLSHLPRLVDKGRVVGGDCEVVPTLEEHPHQVGEVLVDFLP